MERMSSYPVAFLIFLLSFPLPLSAQNTKDTKKPIKFGLQVAQQQTTVEELKEVWQEAEALGFDTLWTNDHLLPSVGPIGQDQPRSLDVACRDGNADLQGPNWNHGL